jgi:hypothetical protein
MQQASSSFEDRFAQAAEASRRSKMAVFIGPQELLRILGQFWVSWSDRRPGGLSCRDCFRPGVCNGAALLLRNVDRQYQNGR